MRQVLCLVKHDIILLPSDLFKELPSIPPAGNIFTLLKDVDTMLLLHPLEEIIEASIEDATTIFEFGPCDIPGVGIIVPMGEELTSWGYGWL
jgi:hypothetical protein